MSKIREVIKINSGYTSYVDLSSDFFYFNEKLNFGRMERYMPIKAHRLAFEKIANALNPKDRRFYFLSGSYGTGKSHLCLMLGNYFAKQSNSLEMETFFKNYEISQKEVLLRPGEVLSEKPAIQLKANRKEGEFLVAICRYDLSLEFEGTILRAIEEAIEMKSISIELDTQYKEALRRIEGWEVKKSEKRFFNDFKTELEISHAGYSLASLDQDLKDTKESALNVFKQIYKVVTDTDFTFSKDNLQDILKDILTNENFKKNYKGIAIIYDEFGYALDANLVNLNRLHAFAQFCANSGLNHLPVIFVGTGHKSFRNHGQVGDMVHYNTLKDRVNEIALQTEGMEDLISAIIYQKKDTSVWRNEVVPYSDNFSRLPVECKRLGIFNWLPAPKLKKNIIENIYPMHPLATYALLQMARDLGSDNRSVSKFFSPEFDEMEEGKWVNIQDHSYPWFIENNKIILNGQLKLYTTDLLVEYFKDSIESSNNNIVNRIRSAIADYQATLRSINSYIQTENKSKLFTEVDEFMYRILKVMLVNAVVSNEKIPIINTPDNIFFALDAVVQSDKNHIINRLDLLCNAGILYKNENKVYEFKRSDVKDVKRMVKEYAANSQNHPTDALEKFLKFVPWGSDEQFLEAKDYNTTYNEDKRLKTEFVSVSALEQIFQVEGRNLNLFEKVDFNRTMLGYGKDSYEGTALYVFCETKNAIEQAKKLIHKNNQDRVIIGIPKEPLEVSDDILTLMAVDYIQESKEIEGFGPHENVQMNEIRKAAKNNLERAKNNYFSNTNINWFWKEGKSLVLNDAKRYDPANKVMDKVFNEKRNTFQHTDFNKAHIKNEGIIRRIMGEAGNLLLDFTQNVCVDWTSPDNRGDKKYLRRCFVDNQVVRQVLIEGDKRYFDIEKNIKKFKNKLPAYDKILSDLDDLKGKGPKSCKRFFQTYFEEWGQSEIAITLMLLLARRFYGDSLRFKREEGALTDINIDNTEVAIELVTGKVPNAVLIFEEISKEEKDYFNLICQIFNKDGIKAGRVYGIDNAYKAIVSWWKSLPVISRSEEFFTDEYKPYVNTLNKAETKNPFIFVKYDILFLFNILKGEKITKDKLKAIKQKIEEFKKNASEVLGNKEKRLLAKIAELFNAKGILDIDIQDAIHDWYNDLDSYQKDPYSKFFNNESKIIIMRINQLSNIRELLFKIYPESFGFGCVSDWARDSEIEYLTCLEKGKHHIEKNKSPVGDVSVEYENALKENGDTVRYKEILTIRITPQKKEDFIYYTDNGSDPSDENSERKRYQLEEPLVIKGDNRIIRFVVCDKDGSYGKINKINVIDDTYPNQIKIPAQGTLGDTTVNFVFPKDKEGVRSTMLSLFREIQKAKIISSEEFKILVKELLEKVEREND